MNGVCSIRQAIEALGKDVLVTDTKSMADYAARIARASGHELCQRKQETGGWELRAREVPRRRRKCFNVNQLQKEAESLF
jgi:hypothetical protein